MSETGSLLDAAADLEHRLRAWAGGQSDVHAVFLVGSRARSETPADEWSDLDVAMIADDPDRYLESTQWLRAIGTVRLTFLESTPDGVTMERRVLFEGGVDVDFIPRPLEGFDEELKTGETAVPVVLQRGYRFLVDKIGLEERLAPIIKAQTATQEDEPPDEDLFLNIINDFWYHCIWVTKKLRRGEVWTAWGGMSHLAWHALLPMLEWQAKSENGPDYETWHSGRFLEQWSAPEVPEALRSALPGYGAASIAAGLTEMMNLFSHTARDVAEHLDYLYPETGEEHVRELVAAWLDGFPTKE